jgi:hypothetical protein
MGFNSINPKSAMGRGDKLEDIFGEHFFSWKSAVKTQSLRPIGPVLAYEHWWFTIQSKTKGVVSVPRLCLDLDPYTDAYTSDLCPYRSSGLGRQNRFYIFEAIWRKKQDEQPGKLKPRMEEEKKLVKLCNPTPDFPEGWKGYKLAAGSTSWTPIVVVSISAHNAANIASLVEENIVEGRSYDAAHEDYGFDLDVRFDPKGTGSGKYSIVKGKETYLEDDEMDYLRHKLDVLHPVSQKEAEADIRELRKVIVEEDDKEDKFKGRSVSKLDQSDEDDGAEDQDQDRDRRSSRRSAASATPAKPSRFRRRESAATEPDDGIPF